MFRKKTLSIVVAILLLLIIAVFVQLGKNKALYVIKSLNLTEKMFLDPKVISLKVSLFGILPVGEAVLEDKGIEVYLDKQVYHLSGSAYALGIISKFFNAKAQIDSYVDKDKLHTLKFTQSVVIPDKPLDQKEVLYDQANHIMELKGKKREILADSQDPLSAIFYLRHQPMELNKEFDININTNQKNYRFYVKVAKKEEYTIRGKKIGVWVLQGDIRRRDKSLRHTSKITFWVLDNPYKTPVLIKVMASGASIAARLLDLK